MSDELKKRLKKYLEENGYGGLWCTEESCGCFLDDLVPCGEPLHELCCEPGYKVPCRADCTSDNCETYRRGEEGVWCITPDKPDEEQT